METNNESNEKSLFPITDSGRPAAKEAHQGFLNERDLQRTVDSFGIECFADRADERTGDVGFDTAFWRPGMASAALPAGSSAETSDVGKAEREAMEKPSLIYVRKVSASPAGFQTINDAALQLGLGLATGTRLGHAWNRQQARLCGRQF